MSIAVTAYKDGPANKPKPRLFLEVPDGADFVRVSTKKNPKLFDLPLSSIKVTPGISEPFIPDSIPKARCVGVNSPEYSLSLVTDSDEDGARLLALLGVEPEEDLDENAFSNTAPVKRESKKSPGVATLMHGGMDFTAHFSNKPSTQVRLVLKHDDHLQVLSAGKRILDLPLTEITDVYVGIMSPVLREKKDVNNSAAFTIKGGGMDLNLEAENGEQASQWLDGLKQALQSRSQEIVVNPIPISP